MPKAPDPLAEFVRDQLRGWAPVTVRPLFSGWGIYNGPIMFGLIARDAIYFRTDDANRPDFEAAGMEPYRYAMPNGKTMTMSYSQVPAEAMEDAEELAAWARKAHQAALRVAHAKKTKPPAAKPMNQKAAPKPRGKRR